MLKLLVDPVVLPEVLLFLFDLVVCDLIWLVIIFILVMVRVFIVIVVNGLKVGLSVGIVTMIVVVKTWIDCLEHIMLWLLN